MSKWVFRLTGLLVVALIALLFLDRFLNPDVPNALESGVDVRTQGEAQRPNPAQVETPEAPALSLTSLEGEERSAAPQTAPASQPQTGAAQDAPAISLTALESPEPVPVLSNPDSSRANVWLQAGSFAERSNADKRAAVLKAHSWSIDIEPVVIDGRTLYRVFVGPLTHDQVGGYMDKLNAMGINAREMTRN